MTPKQPIYGLLRRIDDDGARRDTTTLVNYLEISTVPELTRYSRERLEELDVTGPTISAIERVLHEHYKMTFSVKSPPKKAAARRITRQPKSSPRPSPPAGGAAPLQSVSYMRRQYKGIGDIL